MELVFKKYHKSEQHTEKNYLIYDPAQNPMQLTSDLFRSIAHRNFIQNCESILVGPIMDNKKITVRVLNPDGMEVSYDADTQKIFETYLKDNGYSDTLAPETDTIKAFGTVYHFTA